jgi:phosphate transport system protein
MIDRKMRTLDQDLKVLTDKVTEMGRVCETMLIDALDSLSRSDPELARATISLDKRLDVLQREIEEICVQVIARRQPVSGDLREIVSTMRIASDLERVGDLAKNIAKRTVSISAVRSLPPGFDEIKRKGELAVAQIRDSLDAYIRRDEDRAEAVWLRNSCIEVEDEAVSHALISSMIKNPRNITTSTQLLFSSKNLDHVVDHAVNIAESVHYMVTGEMFPLERPKAHRVSI